VEARRSRGDPFDLPLTHPLPGGPLHRDDRLVERTRAASAATNPAGPHESLPTGRFNTASARYRLPDVSTSSPTGAPASLAPGSTGTTSASTATVASAPGDDAMAGVHPRRTGWAWYASLATVTPPNTLRNGRV
jgi:hypothetical protein